MSHARSAEIEEGASKTGRRRSWSICGKRPITDQVGAPVCDTYIGASETDEFIRLGKIDIVDSQPDSYFVFERSRKMLFLLDTGAAKSILPS